MSTVTVVVRGGGRVDDDGDLGAGQAGQGAERGEEELHAGGDC